MRKIIFTVNSFLFVLCMTALVVAENEPEKEIMKAMGPDTKLEYITYKMPDSLFKKASMDHRYLKGSNYLSIWKIIKNDSLAGIAIKDIAFGKIMPFSYLLILDNDGNILHTSILNYREAHGREIRSQHWLKQFSSKNAQSDLKVGVDIDSISGATISTNALTNKIKFILKSYYCIIENSLKTNKNSN